MDLRFSGLPAAQQNHIRCLILINATLFASGILASELPPENKMPQRDEVCFAVQLPYRQKPIKKPSLRLAAATLAAIAISLAGCAGSERAYQGTPRAKEDVAIMMPGKTPNGNILFQAVDGEQFDSAASDVELLPGERQVLITYWDMVHCIPLIECMSPTSYFYDKLARLEVSAGHTYEVNASGTYADRPNPIRIEIVDQSSGEVVWEGTINSTTPRLILR